MRTVLLEAVLESEIRVLRIDRNFTRDTVTLEVDGETMTIPVGSKVISTLHGNYKRDDGASCRSL